MRDVAIAPELVQDPFEKNVPGFGRDPERTPMQWTSGPNAGFSSGRPWLPLADDAATVNVQVEEADPESLLSFYRTLLNLRRQEDALSVGSFTLLELAPNLLVFQRSYGKRCFTIILNFSAEEQLLRLPEPSPWRVVLSTNFQRKAAAIEQPLLLMANEGLVLGPLQ